MSDIPHVDSSIPEVVVCDHVSKACAYCFHATLHKADGSCLLPGCTNAAESHCVVPIIAKAAVQYVCSQNGECEHQDCAHKNPHDREWDCGWGCSGCGNGICVPVAPDPDPDAELKRLGDDALRYHRMWQSLGTMLREFDSKNVTSIHPALIVSFMGYIEEKEEHGQ